MLKIESITDEAHLAALVPEWEALNKTLSPRLPFTSPLWCLTWWKYYQRSNLKTRDELRVYVLRDATGELAAVAPMFLTHRPGRGPIRTRELQFFGADSYVTELRGPVCRLERTAEVVAALSAHLATSGGFDWVQWRGLRLPADFDGWRGTFLPNPQLGTIDYILPLAHPWEAFRSGLPRNIKESMRKCYNSLARDKHSFTLKVVSSPDEVPAALARFFELHENRAEKTGTIDHDNVFDAPQARSFLTEYCQSLAREGSLRIFQIVINDQVVANRIGFALDGDLYLYFSGYDVVWGQYSVMTTVVAEAIKWAIENGFKVVNLSTGTDVSKTRWRPEPIHFTGGFTVAPALSSRVAFAIIDRLRKRSSPKPPGPANSQEPGASGGAPSATTAPAGATKPDGPQTPPPARKSAAVQLA